VSRGEDHAAVGPDDGAFNGGPIFNLRAFLHEKKPDRMTGGVRPRSARKETRKQGMDRFVREVSHCHAKRLWDRVREDARPVKRGRGDHLIVKGPHSNRI